MINILLCHYNNYFNRILKKLDSVQGYRDADTTESTAHYIDLENFNFTPDDGVTTKIVVGKGAGAFLDWDISSPDYLIVYDSTTVENVTTETIKSRWFILDMNRTRGGQYEISLKRDVLADFDEQVMNSPCYVEKGAITDVNNPLILNPEGMSFNQIKQSEDYIKDNSRCAWLVGYLKKDIDATDLTNINPITYTEPGAGSNIPAAGDFDWEPCIQYIDTTGTPVNNSFKDCFYYQNADISWRTWYNPNYFTLFQGNVRTKITANFGLLYISTDFPHENWGKINSCALEVPSGHKVSDDAAKKIVSKVIKMTTEDTDCRSKFETMVDTGKNAEFGATAVIINDDILKYNGTKIKKNSKVYQLEISPAQNKTVTHYFTGQDSVATSWLTTVASKVDNCNYNSSNPTMRKVQIDYRGKAYTIVAREVILNETISYSLPVSSARNNCKDAAYDMFCMPVDPKALGITVTSDPVVIQYTNSDDDIAMADISAISELQLAMATTICTKLGANSDGSLIYDLQLLPYCPFEGLNVYYNSTTYGPTYGKWVINADSFTSAECTLIYNSASPAEVQGIVFYPTKANFSTGVDYVVPNESVYDEWQTVINPVLKAQGTHDGLPLYAIGFNNDFPYKVKYNSVWDINADDDLIIEDGLTKEECEYLFMQISSGLQQPVIYMTSTEFPTPPVGQEYSYTFTGNFTIQVKANWIVPDRPIDIKIQNECDFYRLTSPNFTSIYEFKKSKLKDGLLSFNIDCSYKPFTPYIKINPNYDNSYYAVKDFNDNMGLICSGDFSIPMLSDAFINYELQNRNYQAIFNRSIQNLDVNQRIAKEQQQFQGIVGAITAPVTGGLAGAATGAKAGPYGAIAGAAVGLVGGAALGTAGYVKDMEWLEQSQSETRKFEIDKFNYSLGNTQALNATITKSSPLTYNNKIWPILELFSCTDTEKEVLRNKIKYDGMTIMAIGMLNTYSEDGCYLKGKIIRLLDIKDDSHIANVIYDEVNKGFYKGE